MAITAAAPGEDGFHLVNIAQPGNTSLQVEYLGGAEPTLIRPNWIDHAIRSPLLVALVVLLSLCAGVGQLLIANLEYVGARPGGGEMATGGEEPVAMPGRPSEPPSPGG